MSDGQQVYLQGSAEPAEHLPFPACRTCQATAALEQYGGPPALPSQATTTGLMAWRPSSATSSTGAGWGLAAAQEASYFALRLPQGWWLFGLDLALLDDIDMCQCRCVLCLSSAACMVQAEPGAC